MKFIILEASKRKDNIHLTGYFSPSKRREGDTEVVNTLIESVMKYELDKTKNIAVIRGTIFIYREPSDNLAIVLKTLSSTVPCSIKVAKNIRCVGNIDKDELNKILHNQFKVWSSGIEEYNELRW